MNRSENPLSFEIPHRIKQKVVTAQDAVSLIQPGDTVAVTGFVCQGAPEGILRALADRYRQTGLPNQLTLFFGGGPGDWDWRGLNHLALTAPTTTAQGHSPPPMLARTLGSHYGQVPKVAALALAVGFLVKSILSVWCICCLRPFLTHFVSLATTYTQNETEAWTLPMGSVSRMWRAQSSRSPGHLTTIGLGTYMVG